MVCCFIVRWEPPHLCGGGAPRRSEKNCPCLSTSCAGAPAQVFASMLPMLFAFPPLPCMFFSVSPCLCGYSCLKAVSPPPSPPRPSDKSRQSLHSSRQCTHPSNPSRGAPPPPNHIFRQARESPPLPRA